ncbi:MAG TPA: TraB/GumN family protein [Allosphingosinicella sp.]|jgi:hypothetical protein
MLKKKFIAAVLAAVALPAAAGAEALPNVSPAMWVVKDADTTIYMFGTFHMLDGKRDWFNDEVKTAFDASSELVLETLLPENPAEMQPLIMKYAVDPAGKTLSQKLTPDVKAKLDKELSAAGLPPQAVEPLEPWFISMTLAQLGAQKLGLKPEFGPETVLRAVAKEKGKSVGQLETVEFQIATMDSVPESEQVLGVSQTIEKMDEMGKAFGPMIDAWSSGNVEGLAKITNEGMDKMPALRKALFVDRNAKWADWIGQRMEKPGVVFMAVGAGHLAGPDSVQDFLKKKGLKAVKVAR